MARALFTYFKRRRKLKVLNLAQKQVTKSIGTVSELEKAITAFSKGKKDEAEKSIEKLFLEEEEIDDLRRVVFEELTKGSLPRKYRNDLMHLIKRLDVMADHVKDSARNVAVLMQTNVPEEILEAYVHIAKTLVECATSLSSSIESLAIDPYLAKELTLRVDSIEGRIDDEYLKIKSLFIKYTNEVNFATLMILKDLLESIENAADMCADTADYIRILAVGT